MTKFLEFFLLFSDDRVSVNENLKTTTSSFLSDLWGSVTYNGKGPTSLSEFVAPGAQVPAKPPGRPSITKVTLTPPLGPGPVPMAEDLQGPTPRQAKSPPHNYYGPKNDTMSWYYNNYNKSELDPYIGPGGGATRAAPINNSAQSLITVRALCLTLACSLIALQ